MKIFKVSFFTLLFIGALLNSNAQPKTKSYSLKKGQVFDIILLSNKPDVKDKLNDYFARAFPIAKELGYTSLGGHAIKIPTQGNYHPQTMVFGSWPNLNNREKFLQDIDGKMSDFHVMRRDIWSSFFLTYYEVKKDISFDVNPDKFNVVTAYWEKDEKSFQKFQQEWSKKAQRKGAKILIELTDGASPFGYEYNPQYLSITEWESKEAFDKYYKENLKMDHSSVKHVNQFIL